MITPTKHTCGNIVSEIASVQAIVIIEQCITQRVSFLLQCRAVFSNEPENYANEKYSWQYS
jgi:hypothetical protein